MRYSRQLSDFYGEKTSEGYAVVFNALLGSQGDLFVSFGEVIRMWEIVEPYLRVKAEDIFVYPPPKVQDCDLSMWSTSAEFSLAAPKCPSRKETVAEHMNTMMHCRVDVFWKTNCANTLFRDKCKHVCSYWWGSSLTDAVFFIPDEPEPGVQLTLSITPSIPNGMIYRTFPQSAHVIKMIKAVAKDRLPPPSATQSFEVVILVGKVPEDRYIISRERSIVSYYAIGTSRKSNGFSMRYTNSL